MREPLLTRYMQPLLAGRRAECFRLVSSALNNQYRAEDIVYDVVWPAMSQLERLYRDDRVDTAVNNMAWRINRTVADQVQAHLPQNGSNGKRAVITCSSEPSEEIGAEMLSDLLQASGWEIYLLGSGVPNDELLKIVGELRPEILLIYGSQPSEVPDVRQLVEMIRDIGVCPTMNIVASGGVFNRVDALWQEIGADALIAQPRDAVSVIDELPPRVPGPRKLGIVKKRRRKRKVAV